MIGQLGLLTRLPPVLTARHQEREKKALMEPEDHALGRSRGGFGSKIHFVCDRNGIPISSVLSGANRHDAPYFEPVLKSVSIPQRRGRPKNRPAKLVADKGYDSGKIRKYCRRRGIKSMIPEKVLPEGKKRRKRGPKPKFEKETYKARNIVERMIGWLKNCRRIAFRFDKLALSFHAMVKIAMIRHYVVKCL